MLVSGQNKRFRAPMNYRKHEDTKKKPELKLSMTHSPKAGYNPSYPFIFGHLWRLFHPIDNKSDGAHLAKHLQFHCVWEQLQPNNFQVTSRDFLGFALKGAMKRWISGLFIPETNSLHLKIDGWKTILRNFRIASWQVWAVSFRGYLNLP